MKFGIHLVGSSSLYLRKESENWWCVFPPWLHAIEEAGFDYLFLSENHLTHRDSYISLATAARETATLNLAHACTNVVFRHDTLVASALATIDELAGHGRVICALGSGDTPVRMLHLRPTRVDALGDAVEHIRSLTGGRPVTYPNGSTVTLPWRSHNESIPVYLVGEGPRITQKAGEVADGLVSGNGISPEAIQWTRDHIKVGASRTDRHSEEIAIWYSSFASLHPRTSELTDVFRARLANRARHSMMAAPDLVPTSVKPEAANLIENFDVKQYWLGTNAPLVTNYMIDRYAVHGDADQICAQIEALTKQGVERLMIDFSPDEFDAQIALFGKHIIPEFR